MHNRNYYQELQEKVGGEVTPDDRGVILIGSITRRRLHPRLHREHV